MAVESLEINRHRALSTTSHGCNLRYRGRLAFADFHISTHTIFVYCCYPNITAHTHFNTLLMNRTQGSLFYAQSIKLISMLVICFRGEKLYVTQDKRIKKSKGRKYLWWFICLALVAALVVVALLAATGVIFNASPTTPVESRNFGKEGVNVAGFLSPGSNRSDTVPPIPVADYSNSVPNAVQGQLTFKNMNFKPEYKDPEDPEYKRITNSLSRELADVLRMNEDMEDVSVTVTELK